jgi:hypothetical protein
MGSCECGVEPPGSGAMELVEYGYPVTENVLLKPVIFRTFNVWCFKHNDIFPQIKSFPLVWKHFERPSCTILDVALKRALHRIWKKGDPTARPQARLRQLARYS